MYTCFASVPSQKFAKNFYHGLSGGPVDAAKIR